MSIQTNALFDVIYGNTQIKTYLSSEIAAGKLAHAYIFEGPSGSGKFTLAMRVAAALVPEYSDKILGSGSVDVTVLGLPEDRKTIGIGTVRDLKYRASVQPQELPCQIFIIRDAHTMTPEAQNSLLKILEEPPAGVYIFLLCDSASHLLPTVRSRAPVLRMQVFEENELGELLVRRNDKARALSERSPEDFALLLRTSGGTVGNALAGLCLRKDARAALRDKTAALIGHLRDGKRSDVLLFFASQNFQREELSAILGFLGEAARDMLAVKKCSEPRLLFYLSQETAEEDASCFASESLMKLYTLTDELQDALSANVSQGPFAVRCSALLSEAVL